MTKKKDNTLDRQFNRGEETCLCFYYTYSITPGKNIKNVEIIFAENSLFILYLRCKVNKRNEPVNERDGKHTTKTTYPPPGQ